MNENMYKTGLLAIGLIIFAIALYVYYPRQNNLTRITVVGESQTKISPDTAVITFSVVTQGKQALDAQQENAKRSEAVRAAVETIAAGAKTEFRTSDYSLDPEQDYYSGKMPKILGYEVKNTVMVSIEDLAKVGAIIDAATKAGANSVEGINFIVGGSSSAQGDSMSQATSQAMAKAESIAKSLNGKIVRVVETREFGAPQIPLESSDYYPMMSASANVAAKSYTTPVQAGLLNVRSQIVLVVEIKIG